MFESGQQKILSLEDILLELKNSDPSEYHEVRFVAEKIVDFFKRPANELTPTSIKKRLRFFPLYLSFERLPLNLIEIVLKDAARLMSAAEVVQNARLTKKPTICREEVVGTGAHDHAGPTRTRGRQRSFSNDQTICGRTAFVGANGNSICGTIAHPSGTT